MESQGAPEAPPARRGAAGTSNFRRILALVLALLAVGGAVALLHRHHGGQHPARSVEGPRSVAPPRRFRPPRAGALELAFLGPLSPGKPFDGWTVLGISAVFRGSIRVAFERGHDRIQLRIVKAGPGPAAPAQSGPYAVYYSVKHVDRANGADVQALAQALARVAAKNQRLEPPGMKTFREDPRDQDWQ